MNSEIICKFARKGNMTTTTLYTKFSSLPLALRDELMNYMDYLIQKHQPEKKKSHPKAGCMKGTFVMHDDFNEPLDDFKEYM